MLPRRYRLLDKREKKSYIALSLSKGLKLRSQNFAIYSTGPRRAMQNNGERGYCTSKAFTAAIISYKGLGNSVCRHRVKRLLEAALANLLKKRDEQYRGFHVTIRPVSTLTDIKFATLEDELERVFGKLLELSSSFDSGLLRSNRLRGKRGRIKRY
jgi:ribonuclease P protein component